MLRATWLERDEAKAELDSCILRACCSDVGAAQGFFLSILHLSLPSLSPSFLPLLFSSAFFLPLSLPTLPLLLSSSSLSFPVPQGSQLSAALALLAHRGVTIASCSSV